MFWVTQQISSAERGPELGGNHRAGLCLRGVWVKQAASMWQGREIRVPLSVLEEFLALGQGLWPE